MFGLVCICVTSHFPVFLKNVLLLVLMLHVVAGFVPIIITGVWAFHHLVDVVAVAGLRCLFGCPCFYAGAFGCWLLFVTNPLPFWRFGIKLFGPGNFPVI